MHVIVVGGGEVGTFIAERLSREGHDVALIEQDRRRHREVEERLDVLAVLGSGTSLLALERAGIQKAELLVAVTTNDEVNLVCSMLAKQAGVNRTVVRIESAELRSDQCRKLHRAAGADLVIDPDGETAREISDLLQFGGASEVARMGDGEVIVVGMALPALSPLAGQTLGEVGAKYEPNWEFIFGSVTRGGVTHVPGPDWRLEGGDFVRVACRRESQLELMKLLGLEQTRSRRVLLLGGGRTAEQVARNLAGKAAQVVLVERQPERARELAEQLAKVLVLEGDIADTDVLLEAEVGTFDSVVALTGEDDANMLACLFAKSEGARETIAVLHRLALLPVLNTAGVDVALSPRTALANGVLRLVRGGITAVATFLQGDLEVLELTVREGSLADDAIIAELRLPAQTRLAAYIRDGNAQICRARTQLRDGDHVVVFALPEALDEVRSVFE